MEAARRDSSDVCTVDFLRPGDLGPPRWPAPTPNKAQRFVASTQNGVRRMTPKAGIPGRLASSPRPRRVGRGTVQTSALSIFCAERGAMALAGANRPGAERPSGRRADLTLRTARTSESARSCQTKRRRCTPPLGTMDVHPPRRRGPLLRLGRAMRIQKRGSSSGAVLECIFAESGGERVEGRADGGLRRPFRSQSGDSRCAEC